MVKEHVRNALKEDIGFIDITTDTLVEDKNLSLNFCPTYFDRLPYVDNDIEILMHKHITVYEEKQLTGEANG